MAYSELVKRFDRIRDYMRDFLIYGFRTREDFDQKSPRTYDNERRRIESWLGDDLKWEYRPGGKAVFLSLDAAELSKNPLHRAWQSKSFTDNDITLHFFLLDLLADGTSHPAEELADALLDNYGVVFDVQTVRRKLKEYTELGLLTTCREGRKLCYSRSPHTLETAFPNQTNLPELLAFFSGAAPFSVVGHYLSNRVGLENPTMRFKHFFIVHTLEDQILLTAVEAIHSGARLEVTNLSGRDGRKTVCQVVPVKIMVSVQTGRQYLVARRMDQRRFSTFRLDYIQSLTPLPGQPGDEQYRQLAEEHLSHAWGPALPGQKRLQHITLTLAVNEEREGYILQRLRREGRGGQVEQVEPGIWRYTNEVYDIGEMMNWVKTFTGRICSVEGDNRKGIHRVYRDLERMADLYAEEKH